MQTGVYALNDGFLWRCPECSASADTPVDRESARNAFKTHRALCRGAVATAPKPPTVNEEEKVAAPTKVAEKKVAK
ncbi:hypothetical protein LCGC14_2280430, partial [marine sediment metagenome]